MPVHVYRPDGEVGPAPVGLAPARTVLTGARIGVLDNGKPNARLLLERLAGRVAERGRATVSIVIGKGTAATPAEPEVLDALRENADLVVTGSAD